MTSLTLATILQASIIAVGADDYAAARRETTDTGRPMVILVGADWCPACQTMKNEVVPQVKRRGLLGRVAYAVVNLDRQKDLGQQLVADGPIPQFIMYRKTREGWKRRRLVGGQNAETVEAFIKEGLELDKNDKLAHNDASP
ncbi:MAG: thioredoxin family protein [Planctomycetia bacterium]|nr:thioredoxin family protein [Planctomycetia bacterium]